MAITYRVVLLILAFVMLAVAALGVKHAKVDLIAAGLALYVLAALFG